MEEVGDGDPMGLLASLALPFTNMKLDLSLKMTNHHISAVQWMLVQRIQLFGLHAIVCCDRFSWALVGATIAGNAEKKNKK